MTIYERLLLIRGMLVYTHRKMERDYPLCPARDTVEKSINEVDECLHALIKEGLATHKEPREAGSVKVPVGWVRKIKAWLRV